MRRRVYLLRHAEVAYFTPEGGIAKPRAVPLTERGREQARAAAHALEPAPFDRALTSGLPRTVETARLVLADRQVPLEEEPGFEEIRTGKLTDIPEAERERSFTAAFSQLSGRDPSEIRFLGGETFSSLRERVAGAWGRVLGRADWNELLLVAHGGVNRVILALALGAGPEVFGRIEQDPACINIIDVDGTGPKARHLVRAVNLTPYNLSKEGIRETTMEGLWSAYRKMVESGHK